MAPLRNLRPRNRRPHPRPTRSATAALFATKTPSTTPTDPGERQDHLRALALLALTTANTISTEVAERNRAPDRTTTTPNRPDRANRTNSADESGSTAHNADDLDRPDRADNADDLSRSEPADDPGHADNADNADEWDRFTMAAAADTKRFGRPESTVVIDTTNLNPDGHPTVDWGIPIHIPWTRIQNLCHNAAIRPVIIHHGTVIDADGQLNLGRTTRLANRAQRRALRALYPTCAIPGCTVTYNHTKLHHVHWWRDGGPTDLANLLPLCSQHHHAAHEGGWILTLQPNRQLTIKHPTGTTMHTGPPHRQHHAA